MRRREFLGVLGGAVAAWPVVAHAQQPGMPVIGILDAGSAADRTHAVAAFRQGLAEAGLCRESKRGV
jgi:putative tryptophan/tyrosine transport system substrate-binding protein